MGGEFLFVCLCVLREMTRSKRSDGDNPVVKVNNYNIIIDNHFVAK